LTHMTDQKEKRTVTTTTPCCDPRYQDLCGDEYFPEDYFGYDEEEEENEEE